jgi:hypothetical protein
VARRDEISYDRRTGPRDRNLRVGDAEREAASDTLRAHYVKGRIDADEFQQRLERCLTARTYADLDPLFSDLPGPEGARRPAAWRRSLHRHPWPIPLLPIAIIAIVAVSLGHVPLNDIPLVFIFVVTPIMWGGYGGWHGPGPRRGPI